MHIYGTELCRGLWNGTCNVPQVVYKYSCSILHDRCVNPIPRHSLVHADVSHEGYMSCGMFNVFLCGGV